MPVLCIYAQAVFSYFLFGWFFVGYNLILDSWCHHGKTITLNKLPRLPLLFVLISLSSSILSLGFVFYLNKTCDAITCDWIDHVSRMFIIPF